MDDAVLADLEPGEMEPERRELPAQVLDLAPCDAGQSVPKERVLDLGQLGVQVRCGFVASGERCLLAGEVGPRPAEPLGDEPEPLAVRLVRKAAAQLAIELGQELGVAGEAGDERPGNIVRVHGRRDRLGQTASNRLVAAQDVVGLDPERALGDLGGDRRVAVPVATDPRPPAQKRRDPRRTGAGRVGVCRLAVGAGRPVEGGIGQPIEAWHDTEQRLVEERQRGPDLVERRRGDSPQVGRPPQQRDLLAQATTQLAILGCRQVTVVESRQQPVDPSQREQQRPPSGLGRVGREDRVIRSRLEPARRVVEARSPRATRPGPSRRQRAGDRNPAAPTLLDRSRRRAARTRSRAPRPGSRAGSRG